MPELSWEIDTLIEDDYDGVSCTAKHVCPKIDGEELPHCYVRSNTETDIDAKTAVRLDLTDKGYTWTTEV